MIQMLGVSVGGHKIMHPHLYADPSQGERRAAFHSSMLTGEGPCRHVHG
jgi:hypothetical protein